MAESEQDDAVTGGTNAPEGQPDGTPRSPEGNRSLRLIAALGLLAVVLSAAAYGYASRPRDAIELSGAPGAADLRGFILDPAGEAPGFELVDQNGDRFRLEDTRGKLVMLFFGFTYCPDVCPLTLGKLTAGLQASTAKEGDVQVLFVTVDPERDTPEQMARYLETFEAPVLGLSGELDEIQAVAAEYGVHFEKEFPEGGDAGGDDYTMIHSSTVFLIDAEGRLRAGMIDPPPEDVAHDVDLLLQERGG